MNLGIEIWIPSSGLRLAEPFGALLFFLLLNWGTEIIYHSDDDYYGEQKLAYYLEIEDSADKRKKTLRRLLISSC